MELFLVRHAQSHPSDAIPHPDWPLSERGHVQARALIPVLRELEIGQVYTSPFVRTQHTIAPFVNQAAVPLDVHDALRERALSPTFLDDPLEVWTRSWADFDFALPGCESSRTAQTRMVAAVQRIIAAAHAAAVAICSHGNVISLLLHHLDPSFGIDQATRLRNPEVLRIVVDDGQMTWDTSFDAPALDAFATAHHQSPVTRTRRPSR